MKILLLIKTSYIEFLKGFVNFLKNPPYVFIANKFNNNKYIKQYLKDNHILIINNLKDINLFDLVIMFEYRSYKILNKLNYKGKIISHAHGISLKPYFPNKLGIKNFYYKNNKHKNIRF